MKKVCIVLVAIALLITPVFGGTPTSEEIGETLGSVMSVYYVTIMSTMVGAPIEGVKLLNIGTDKPTMEYTNFDVRPIFASDSSMGAMMGVDMGNAKFTHMSGTVFISDEGDLELDVTLKGGPINSLEITTQDAGFQVFNANGKDFRFLATDPSFMGGM